MSPKAHRQKQQETCQLLRLLLKGIAECVNLSGFASFMRAPSLSAVVSNAGRRCQVGRVGWLVTANAPCIETVLPKRRIKSLLKLFGTLLCAVLKSQPDASKLNPMHPRQSTFSDALHSCWNQPPEQQENLQMDFVPQELLEVVLDQT